MSQKRSVENTVDNSDVTVPFISISDGDVTYSRFESDAESKLFPSDQTRSPGLFGSRPK